MPFVNEREFAEAEIGDICAAKERLAAKAGKDRQLLLLHPTIKTVRYASFLQDQKVPTGGQLAFERVKASGALVNYALYSFAAAYFSRIDPSELQGLWRSFRDNVGRDGKYVYAAWKKNLLNTKFRLLCDCLAKHKIGEALRTQYVRYVNSVLALGFVVYRDGGDGIGEIRPQRPQPKRHAKITQNNNFTETQTSTAAISEVSDTIGKITLDMRDKILSMDDIIVAIDRKTGTYFCEPIIKRGQKDCDVYRVLLFEEPGHHNPVKGYCINSICAKIDPQVTDTLRLYNIYKESSAQAASTYRALLARDDTNDFAEVAGAADAESQMFGKPEDLDHTVTQFLIELHNKNTPGVDSVMRDLASGNFKRKHGGDGHTNAIKKVPILETLDPLFGRNVVEKSTRDFSARFLAPVGKMKTATTDGDGKTMTDYISKRYRAMYEKATTYEKCLGNLATVSKRLARDKESLNTRYSVLCDNYQRLLSRQRDDNDHDTTKTELYDTFLPTEDTTHHHETHTNHIIPDGYKVMSASVTPRLPDFMASYKILSDHWISILRDIGRFVPVYNPTGERIDEKPSISTEQTLYKPFLTLVQLATFYTTSFEEPLAALSLRVIFDTVFEDSLCGLLMRATELEDADDAAEVNASDKT